MKFSYNQLYSESFAGGFQKTSKPQRMKPTKDRQDKKKKDYSEERSRKRGEVNFD